MTPRVTVTETESVKTTALPAAPLRKWLWAQKRWWALLLALAINVSMLVFTTGMSIKEAFKDEKSVLIVGLIVASLLHVAGFASTVRGAMPTAISRKSARPVPQLPVVEATSETSTTRTSEGYEAETEYDRARRSAPGRESP